MKKELFILMILLLFSGLYGQEKGILISVGGAGYQMDDLEYLQEQILTAYPVEGKILNSFPPYSAISVNFLKKIRPMLKIGAGYSFSSTGGRSNYTDYSGNITTDIIAKSHRLGVFASYSVINGERFDLGLFGRVDANFTRVGVSTSTYVLGYSSLSSNKYKSISPNLSTGVELFYNFKAISLGIDGGFLLDVPANLKESELGGNLTDPDDYSRKLTSNWTGWRAGIKAIIWIPNNSL